MYESGYPRISILGLLALVLCARPVRAQEPPCTSRKLPVSFRDAQNAPLQNISIGDLEAKIHGRPVKIVSLEPDPRPHRIVLILDTSGSMGSLDRSSSLWKLELTLALHFFEVNKQRAQIALVFFNTRVTDVIDFAQGNAAAGAKLLSVAHERDYGKTHIKGQTALRDAILQGIQLFARPNSADAIYALTDGGDNASRQGAGELNRRLAVSSVRLFAVLLGRQDQQPRNRSPEELFGPSEFLEIARKSGGEILSAAEWHGGSIALSANLEAKVNSEETLNRLYQTILRNSQLQIELPFPVAKSEHWDLKLSHDARQQWKNAQITYPDVLAACDAEVSGSSRH